MKIYHGSQNIGGMAGVFAQAQRELGADAYSYCFPTIKYNFPIDRNVKATSKLGYLKEISWFFLTEGIRTDVFQFYFGSSLAGSTLLDIRILKLLNKKIFFYFCGCDIRDSKITIEKYSYSACKECWPMQCSPNQKKALKMAARYAAKTFVSTPDLLEFVPNSVLIPQPIDLDKFQALKTVSNNNKQIIKIAHAPSNRQIKGTKYIENAIAELQKTGYPIELILVENKPYLEALNIYLSADLTIDQLLVGSYGQFSVEMMALGKPVICYIRDDLRCHYREDLPVISASPENLIEVLKKLLDDPAQWPKLSEQGIEYVKKVHESKMVAALLLKYYGEK